MSSDESTSTNISTFSNRSKKGLLNEHSDENWEVNLIGNFVLNLYHRSVVTSDDDWYVKKSEMRKEYSQLVSGEIRQKLTKLYGTDNVGALLSRCGFLINTISGGLFYKIKCKTLFDFRNNKIKELDNKTINSDGIKQKATNDKESDSILLNLIKKQYALEEEIDESEPKMLLEYQASTIQRRLKHFCPTNMSCYICEEDFSTMESFEQHIQTHGEETDFKFLTTMGKFNSPIFTISYTLCKNSHNFCFEVETSLEDVIMEKIIIVQSRSFFYIHNTRVPYKCPENGINRFFVDSHLFTRHVEHPIVLICHLEHSKDSRIIEQHHFMRSEEFPKVNFSINPYRLPNKKIFEPKFQLADYFPRKEIQDALNNDFCYTNLMQISNEFRDYIRNGKNLQPQTIAATLNILLQIEDMDTILEYLRLRQNNIKLRSYGDEYSFQLKTQQGIFLENKLTIYDEVILTTHTDIFTKADEVLKLMMQSKSDIRRMENTFVGLIQAVNTGRISFKCDQNIDIHGSYTVICRPSRLNFRYQYRSLDLLPTKMDFLKKFLFPTKIIPMPLSTISLNLYNKNINTEQLQAVRNIAEGPRNDATYIIFGPPGTGKTTTLVESILQVLRKPDTKIVVTASSNSACDEVALRLCKYLNQLDIKRAMVRIYSRSSEVRTDTIDDELLENSNMYNGQFYPDVEILHEYRVVICTLSIVAKLATGKFGRKENGGTLYTHLIIDEIAAAMESEALMAITTILTSKSCLIISGDHKQLGPVLQSKRAKELGLDTSLMDRLLARDCYRVNVDTGDYDRTIQTRLVRNYRSHSAIVSLYSGLFYNHTLEACAKPENVSICEVWHKSRNKQYPILFHAVYEPSKSDNHSHSMYNLMELHVVMDYVKDLMYFGINGESVNESDIGIISPYKTQYTHIREELNLRKWFNIETGSVETFQGKEKNIIIVSFVRSGSENLGFLDDPRRLNVTISRPKSFLIIIGNPKTLSLNSDFEYIIKECQRNNTFIDGNDTSRGNLIQQSTGDLVMSEEKLFQLNRTIQTPNINHEDQKNDTETVQRNRQQGQNRRRNNFNNNEESNKENYVQRDVDIKDDDKNEREDEEDYKNNKTNATAWDAINFSNIEKSRKGYEVRQSQNDVAATGGVISKQHSRGGQKNQNVGTYNKSKISTQTPAVFTNAQLLQMQQQHQFYYNLQQNQKHLNHNNIPFFNVSTISDYRLMQNLYITQQMQNFNSVLIPQPLYYYNTTMTNNTNLSWFTNVNNTTIYSNNNNAAGAQQTTYISKSNKQSSSADNSKVITGNCNLPSSHKDILGEINSAKNNSSNSTGEIKKLPPKFLENTSVISVNSNDNNDSTSSENKDEFRNSVTADPAVDTLKGRNNLPPSMKDEFSENNSAENSSSKSTGAAKKLPKIAANIQVISSNSRDKTSSNSTESRDTFKKTVTVATAAVDTLKYNRDTLIDLQPLNCCEPTFSINKNLSCFKNANNNNAAGSKVIAEKNNLLSTMEDHLGVNFSDKINCFKSTGATKKPPQIIGIKPGTPENSCEKTISNSTERKDAFTTAGAAVDTLKYNRDTLIDLQPLNYCEPTFSINKNLSCFKNANNNNAAGSKVIAEKNNLPSTMEDHLGVNFSDKINCFKSTGATKKPPQIIGIKPGTPENSCEKTISNSTERKDAFTTAGAAVDTLKYNRDTLIDLQPLNCCEPTFSINKNLSCFKNANNNNAAGSKVIAEKNNLLSTMEDHLGVNFSDKINCFKSTGATKKPPQIIGIKPGTPENSCEKTISNSTERKDAFTTAGAAVDTLKYNRDTLIDLQPLNCCEPTFSINKNLSCFKNANNNNAAGSKVIAEKNNLLSTMEDHLGVNFSDKINCFKSTGATKKPPQIIGIKPGTPENSCEKTISNSTERKDAFTTAGAAVDTLKYNRDTLIDLQPLNCCEPTFSINKNLSCFKNANNNNAAGSKVIAEKNNLLSTMEDHLGVNFSDKINCFKSTGATKKPPQIIGIKPGTPENSCEKTISNSTERKDAFTTAGAAVDTLKYNRDTLIDLQPLNCCEPTFSINKNLSCFKNANNNNAAGSKVIAEKNNLLSTMEDHLGVNFSDKINCFKSTGATKKPPQIIGIKPGTPENSCEKTISNSTERKDAFTTAGAAVDTLKYNRDTLIDLQPLNCCEPTFSINKNLSCFKNANNNNAAGSKVIAEKNNLLSTMEDHLGVNFSDKINCFKSTGATKKPPQIIGIKPGTPENSCEKTISNSTERKDAFTTAGAAVDTLKYNRDTLIDLQPLNYCEPTFSINKNLSCFKNANNNNAAGSKVIAEKNNLPSTMEDHLGVNFSDKINCFKSTGATKKPPQIIGIKPGTPENSCEKTISNSTERKDAFTTAGAAVDTLKYNRDTLIDLQPLNCCEPTFSINKNLSCFKNANNNNAAGSKVIAEKNNLLSTMEDHLGVNFSDKINCFKSTGATKKPPQIIGIKPGTPENSCEKTISNSTERKDAFTTAGAAVDTLKYNRDTLIDLQPLNCCEPTFSINKNLSCFKNANNNNAAGSKVIAEKNNLLSTMEDHLGVNFSDKINCFKSTGATKKPPQIIGIKPGTPENSCEKTISNSTERKDAFTTAGAAVDTLKYNRDTLIDLQPLNCCEPTFSINKNLSCFKNANNNNAAGSKVIAEKNNLLSTMEDHLGVNFSDKINCFKSTGATKKPPQIIGIKPGTPENSCEKTISNSTERKDAFTTAGAAVDTLKYNRDTLIDLQPLNCCEPTFSINKNLSCFKNANNNNAAGSKVIAEKNNLLSTMEDHLGVNFSDKINCFKSTGATKKPPQIIGIKPGTPENSCEKTISNSTERKDAFTTAGAAVDTLKYNRDTLIDLQPLNCCEPTFSINKNLSCFKNANNNNAAGSKVIAEKNNLLSTMEDHLGVNFSDKINCFKSTGATKKPPQIIGIKPGTPENSCEKTISNSTERKDAFTTAGAAVDTLKYNRDTLIDLQPLNCCEPTFSINKNLSCFKNANNNNAAGSKVIAEKNNLLSTMEDHLGVNFSDKINCFKSTGATKKPPQIIGIKPGTPENSCEKTISNSTERKDAFTTAGAAVDTLKYNRDTLIDLQPLNCCEPTFSINKNLSCFKNANNNNAAGSKVIAEKNNLLSTMEDHLGVNFSDKINCFKSTGATKKPPQIIGIKPGTPENSCEKTISNSTERKDAFTTAGAAVDTLKYNRDTLIDLQPLNYCEPTFSINKNLSCFKNANNNNAAGSKVIAEKNNLPSTMEDHLGVNFSDKINCFKSTGATKKPPQIIGIKPGTPENSCEKTISNSTERKDAFTTAGAAVDTLKYNRDTLIDLQPLNCCEPTFSINKNLSCFKNANNNNAAGSKVIAEKNNLLSTMEDHLGVNFSDKINCFKSTGASKKPPQIIDNTPGGSKSTESRDAWNKTFTVGAVENLKDKSDKNKIDFTALNSNMCAKSTNIAKPYATAPKIANKHLKQEKSFFTSEAVSKEKSAAPTSGGCVTNIITLNHTDDKPKSNAYPVLRDHFNTFFENSSIYVNLLASSSNIIRPNSSTSINSSSNMTPKSNVSTYSYTSNSNISTNTYNSNNTQLYVNSNTSNTQLNTHFEIKATEDMCSNPVRNLGLFDKQKRKIKKKKSCVIS